ncbi:ceramide synthase 6 [Eurytemora carolleeae]|uniref:ceramide synthase 6 n=1 Tax=Eurytemora carolleeae TaxID=1294199 RepID=UPI000C794D42|nr:ceramide synthase 6 [Eurytemora carolleeae]|eukprot:XP_023326730.1 ceramide synthase 6-like [Eurytemora affinis]
MYTWDETIWLPSNCSWSNFQADDRYAKFSDLLYPLLFAFPLLLVRGVIEQKIFRYVGLRIGFNEKDKKQNSSVSCWIKKKIERRKLSELDKFTETGYRWLCYLFLHILSLKTMLTKPWLWQSGHMWLGYPNLHYIDGEIWFYYMAELTFYWSLFFSQFVDVKRKDFVEMFLHHIATLSLMTFSWICHLHRVGSVVMFVHDFADHWLELGKLLKYAKFQKMCDAVFVVFCSVWVSTRVGIYPQWVLYSTTVEAGQMMDMFPMYYVFNFLLSGLLILHLFWTYFILKAAYKAVMFSDDISDNRSEGDESEPEDEGEEEGDEGEDNNDDIEDKGLEDAEEDGYKSDDDYEEESISSELDYSKEENT